MRQTKYAVILGEEERARLRTLVGSGVAPARMLSRARVLLKADQGEGGAAWSDAAIAGALELHPTTVARIRRQCVEQGVDAALERQRPDRVYPRALDGVAEAHLVAAACSPPPPGVSAGHCGCWPTSWSAWRWWGPSRTRRCGGP